MRKFNTFFLFISTFIFVLPNSVFCQSSDFNFGSFYSGTKNFIEVTYSVGNFKHKNLQSSFNNPILSEIKLGKRFIKPVAAYKILQFNDNYLFSSYLEDNIQNSNKISFKMWRFGVGYRKGYGYKIGNLAVLPYYQLGLLWNKANLTFPGNQAISELDRKILNYYEDDIKFGQTNVAGVDLKISSVFGAGISYETSVIFPYHKAWKQIGSFFIETLTQTGIDYLTEGVILKSAPKIAPVFYFLLKNGLSYYFHTLKQDDMNWPFKTAKPLTFEALKFNLKIKF